MISYQDELSHSGIKGMHWGVRNYRNYDGTLTAAGKARYGSDNSGKRTGSVKKSRSDRKISKARAAKKEAKAAEKKAREAEESMRKEREALEAAKAQQNAKTEARDRIDMQKLSNEELRAQIDRMNLEKQYNDLVNPPSPAKKSKMEKAKTFLANAANISQSLKQIAESAQGIDKVLFPDKYKEKKEEDPNKKLKQDAEAAKARLAIENEKFTKESHDHQRAEWATPKQNTAAPQTSSTQPAAASYSTQSASSGKSYVDKILNSTRSGTSYRDSKSNGNQYSFEWNGSDKAASSGKSYVDKILNSTRTGTSYRDSKSSGNQYSFEWGKSESTKRKNSTAMVQDLIDKQNRGGYDPMARRGRDHRKDTASKTYYNKKNRG